MIKKYPQLRFCKVLQKTKKPFEKDWTKKPYILAEISDHIKKEKNYGVLCGHGDLAVIDSDNPELQKHIEKTLPETFRVVTGSGGVHNYFFIPDLKNKIILITQLGDKDIHWGEVQSHGAQVVGPGSIHPNGKPYKELNQHEITTINYDTLIMAIKPFMRQTQEVESFKHDEKKNYGSDVDDMSVLDIWGTAGLKEGGGEFYGEHPVHGSEGGMNFRINPSKNLWHCFRCNSGGGPLAAVAVKEGIINCNEAQRGYLRQEKFLQAVDSARLKYGLKDNSIDLRSLPTPKRDELSIWKYRDFETIKKDTNFLIEDVLYPKTITMLYSPPGEFKSILCLLMALCVAGDKPWMKFKTQQAPVLYCDKENNDQIIKERLMALFKAENCEDKDLPLFILRRNGDLLDNRFVEQLKETVKKHKIKLIFFDTLHRFADYDENSSNDINRLYTQVFQPLVEDLGCSIVFLHHTKKDGGYRGSGDFLGMVDTAYGVHREKSSGGKSNKFRIVNEKSRAGEIDNIQGEIDFNVGEMQGEDYIKILRLNGVNEEEDKLSRLKEMTKKLQLLIKPGENVQRKDLEDRLEMEGYEYSLATMKRSLKWLVDNQYLDKTKQGVYTLILR